ncbi:MAG: leucine-rich repeat domain-containing protein [Clostridia bacterium]|nr:leucine-rich repeat domain-containing protein [Clostridia bacterium]
MKKKILFTLLLVSVLVCLFAISISAHDITRKVTLDNGTEVALYDSEGNALTWYMDGENLVSKKTVDVISVNGSGVATYNGITTMSVVVANFQGAEVEELGVTQVPSYYYGANGGAYHSYNDTIEYVYLPDTLTKTVTNQFRCTSKLKIVDVTKNSNWSEMGQYSFYYATGLTEFYYPPKVKTTPGGGNDGVRGTAATFSHCTSMKNLYFYDNSETETFGDACFDSCSALEKVELPSTITSLPKNVFSNCTSLKEISISNSIKTIANHAFAWCTSLEVIRMGASFEYFNNTGDNSFTYSAGNVKEIYIPKSFYATAPDTSLGYQVSYAFSGVSADCKFFYCGTVAEFEIAKANFLTQKSATSNNSRFINATSITYAEYLEKKDTYATGNYVICEYNPCEAFYNGIHETEAINGCQGKCQNCGNTELLSTPVHTSEWIFTDAEGNTMDLTKAIVASHTCKFCETVEETENIAIIFTPVGYTQPETGEPLLGYEVKVNQKALERYKDLSGETVQYGLVAGIAFESSDGTPISVDSEGKLVADNSTVIVNMTGYDYTALEIKITGINVSTSLYCNAFITIGTDITYICETASATATKKDITVVTE